MTAEPVQSSPPVPEVPALPTQSNPPSQVTIKAGTASSAVRAQSPPPAIEAGDMPEERPCSREKSAGFSHRPRLLYSEVVSSSWSLFALAL